MREIQFLHQNKSNWDKIERYISGEDYLNPDEIKSAYINLTDNLSYSRTFYPESKTTIYLNELSYRVHSKIYSKKTFDLSLIKSFFIKDLPLAVYSIRKELFISFSAFLIGMLIGLISTAYDDSFVRVILGDEYVNTTLRNIENQDPLAIYKSSGEMDMFAQITINNIMVSFNAFSMGLLTALGSCFILFRNGVMLGSFQQLFVNNGLFWQYFRTVWIHGTLEISAIIIAGGAGIALGNSFLFPGTFSRLESFKSAANKSIKVILGLVPIFIIAGFLESFVTRNTEMHDLINMVIIISSLVFIVFYFVIYPHKIYRSITR